MTSTHPTLRQWRMKHLRAAMSISLVLLLQMVLGVATAGASTVGALRICSSCAAAGELSRYEYVVLQSDQAWRIPGLRAKNPRLKALVYVNASATYAYAQADGRGLGPPPLRCRIRGRRPRTTPAGFSVTQGAIGSSFPTTRTCG